MANDLKKRQKVQFIGSPTVINTETTVRYLPGSPIGSKVGSNQFAPRRSIDYSDLSTTGLDLATPTSLTSSSSPTSSERGTPTRSRTPPPNLGDIPSSLTASTSLPVLDLASSSTSSTSSTSLTAAQQRAKQWRENELWVNTPAAKSDWLEREMQNREDEYVVKSNVRVFVGTWNVNGKKPPDSLAPWLLANAPMADIFAIGLQELDLTASALIAGETAKGKLWESVIIQTLNEQERGSYQLLMSKQLVGMLLCVAVRRTLMPFIKDPRDCIVPVGILGVMGNKGAVSIRFQYADSTFCFVNSHLSAHQEYVIRRNQDFREISAKVQFSTSANSLLSSSSSSSSSSTSSSSSSSTSSTTIPSPLTPSSSFSTTHSMNPSSSSLIVNPSTLSGTSNINNGNNNHNNSSSSTSSSLSGSISGSGSSIGGGLPRSSSFASTRDLANASLKPVRTANGAGGTDVDMWTIYSHHHVFWLGDLNYRIDLNNEVIRQAIARQDWDLLQASDQLMIQKESGQIFEGFREGKIDFAPTYKYDYMSANYDTSEKARLPAWTDRVLWKGDEISICTYQRYEMMSSDHRPVAATFDVVTKSIIPEKRHRIYNELVRKIDKLENDFIPDVRVSEKDINFGEIEYNKTKSRTVTVKNVGHVPARFRFIPRHDQSQISKPWLSVSPSSSVLLPEEEMTLTMTINVNQLTAPPLTLKTEELFDILILRLDRGKDEYLVVSGTYLASSFGCPLEHLIRFPGPIRTSKPFSETDDLLPIPKELWLMIDYLHRYALATPDLFVEKGLDSEVEFIRTCLDTGISLEAFNGSIHSMIATLLLFLNSFPQPVIPVAFFDRCIGNSDSPAASADIVRQLPPVYYNVFHYTMSFLRSVLEHQHTLRVEALAAVFAPILLKPQNLSDSFELSRRKQFLCHFLLPDVSSSLNQRSSLSSPRN